MKNIVIRVNKEKELSLVMTNEKVYFIHQHNKEVFNGLDYDKASDHFNLLEKVDTLT